MNKEIEINLGYLSIANWKEGDNLFYNWMHEDDEYKDEIKNISENEIILFPDTTYTLKIIYPLSKPFVHKFTTDSNGMLRKELVKLIVDDYHQIYKEEDESVGHKTKEIPGMYNRQTSNGKYGIWGHHIDDLQLGTAHIDEKNLITLSVDS
jgi:hypothetical protein